MRMSPGLASLRSPHLVGGKVWAPETRYCGESEWGHCGQDANNHLANENLVVICIRKPGFLEADDHNALKIRIVCVQEVHHLNNLRVHPSDSQQSSRRFLGG